MLELLVIYATRSLPSILICFIGIAATKSGLNRFGMFFKIPLWLVFLFLWAAGILTGVLLGVPAIQKLPIVALPVFLIGILFWIVSLIFGSRK